MNSKKKQKDTTLKDELPRSVDVQQAAGEEQRNSTRKNEEAEPKQKQYSIMEMISDGSKVQCCQTKYCIETWNVRYMNQDKLQVVEQAMAKVNIGILGISELKWT